MGRVRRAIATALLLCGALLQPACSNGPSETAQGVLGNGTSSSASQTSKKFWDRCLGSQCQPMNDDERPKKSQ